ncbi:MAG: metallophosphoesterase [Gaiellaceae bacterium]
MRRRTFVMLGLALALAAFAGAARSMPAKLSAHPRFAIRYVFDSDHAARAAAAAGWNLIDVSSKDEADALPAGTRGLMWLGDYDNTSCSWERSDDEVRNALAGTARDPKIYGFLFSDEADPFACPRAPAEHRARSRLIHAVAPRKLTVVLIDSNSGAQTLAQIPLWKGTADRIALDPYPCYREKACDFAWMRTVVKRANAAKLRYWGTAQAFADDNWRWPTAAEERRILTIWSASRAGALMTFAWTWHGNNLPDRPDVLDVLRRFNGRTTGTRALAARSAPRATEVHYTFTSATSVGFDWRGGATSIRVRVGARWKTFRAHTPSPAPFSAPGPYREVRVTGLRRGTAYRYSIGTGPVATFHTAPARSFRFDVEADIGASSDYPQVARTQAEIAADRPSFVLAPGDLTYANDEGQQAVDRHFDDVMAWSRTAAYMPAWGNHEWDDSSDDLRNYKGRFAIPNPHTSPGAPRAGCCSEDWGWFDAGPVRFISYPDPYTGATWRDWNTTANTVMAAAQRNPRIHFIVTFGHRPAYSTGYHRGDSELASILDSFGDRYSKYVLNINGHSHNYERFTPIHHVVHATISGGGAPLEPLTSTDRRSAFRALHLVHGRIDVTPNRLTLSGVCGPATSHDEFTCRDGAVVDTYSIAAQTR